MMSMFLLLNLNPYCGQVADNNMCTGVAFAQTTPEVFESIISRGEFSVSDYMRRSKLSKIKELDGDGAIRSGLESAQTQVSSLQQVFIGLQGNDDPKVREYVYDQLLSGYKFQKASGFMARAALKSVFDNCDNPNQELRKKVNEMKKKFE